MSSSLTPQNHKSRVSTTTFNAQEATWTKEKYIQLGEALLPELKTDSIPPLYTIRKWMFIKCWVWSGFFHPPLPLDIIPPNLWHLDYCIDYHTTTRKHEYNTMRPITVHKTYLYLAAGNFPNSLNPQSQRDSLILPSFLASNHGNQTSHSINGANLKISNTKYQSAIILHWDLSRYLWP